jgi:hypothetical protein
MTYDIANLELRLQVKTIQIGISESEIETNKNCGDRALSLRYVRAAGYLP